MTSSTVADDVAVVFVVAAADAVIASAAVAKVPATPGEDADRPAADDIDDNAF